MTEVEAYLEAVPEPARTTLEKVRAAIRAAMPADATESIRYGMPMFKSGKAGVGYAAFSDHCGLFVTSGTLLASFAKELAGYQTSKGGVQFPVDKPLPAALIKKLVKARLAL